jgi:hypothetical protein
MVTSSRPSEACTGFRTPFASRIAPAQVPKIAAPFVANVRMACNNPSSSRNCNCVVLSPPGRMSPPHTFNCAGVRTSSVSTLSRRNCSACAETSPCTARIPILTILLPHACRHRRLTNRVWIAGPSPQVGEHRCPAWLRPALHALRALPRGLQSASSPSRWLSRERPGRCS